MSPEFPTATRRTRLGAELRALREARGYTVRGLAAAAGIDFAKLSRLENGKLSKPSVTDIGAVLDALAVNDVTREQIVTLARAANSKGWYKAFTGSAFDRQRRVAELESGVVDMRQYATMFVPGLVQVPAYTRSLYTEATGYAPDEVTAAMQLRRTRQALLDDETFRFEMVLDESVLHRVPGSQAGMVEQLDHLADLSATRTNVSVHVLRLSDGYRPLMPEVGFTLFRYGDPDRPSVAFTETVSTDMVLTAPDFVAQQSAVFDRLRASALTVDESRDAIRSAARHHRKG
ncbi:MAG: helix-turn-helix transcriptional regulator [Actinocatenispora sp.]